MLLGDGSVIVQSGGRGYFARVRVAYFAPDSAADEVTAYLEPPWPELAGYAQEGIALGLELAGLAGRCVVREVKVHEVGAPHATLVAVAAVRAVWSATGFVPAPDLAQRLKGCIGLRGPATAVRERLMQPENIEK